MKNDEVFSRLHNCERTTGLGIRSKHRIDYPNGPTPMANMLDVPLSPVEQPFFGVRAAVAGALSRVLVDPIRNNYINI